ncbi:N-acetylmuramoyl-L-alanine amidase family protein [Ruminiclostridium josui]|uniref:N-acetylmuramoyl-L-alanine amidase family protein n=1 Tax=Ruminiclostridium josui TaxID=1499 RepID=UPI000467599A|nr:N-acetylmuramoyl-L-alanine amidase [Ruminiclostridium josui]
MKMDKLIEKISRRLSHKNLITLIVILSVAIIAFLGLIFRNDIIFPLSNLVSLGEDSNAASLPPLVVIDPGHGGSEPGAVSGSIHEKEITLAISLEVEKLLNEKHIDNILTRRDDTAVSLEDRVKLANEKKCSLFISIHNNSFTDPASHGILTTYNPYSDTGERNAEIMQSKLKTLGMFNRKIVPRPNLYVLRHTEMPSLLLEIGFISNKNDLKLLTSSDFQKKCAVQIVNGIEEILEANAIAS